MSASRLVLVCYGLGVQPPLLKHCYLELLRSKRIDGQSIDKGVSQPTNMTGQTVGDQAHSQADEVFYNGSGISHSRSAFKTVANCIADALERFDEAEAAGESFYAEIGFYFTDDDDTDKFIALFPKYVRVGKGQWSGSDQKRGTAAHFSVDFQMNRDGSKNETGRKRFNRFIKVITQEA
tara:strand:- start:111 stop:647 length:537 start_codon:yes stop_codon:yes gene_type:complete